MEGVEQYGNRGHEVLVCPRGYTSWKWNSQPSEFYLNNGCQIECNCVRSIVCISDCCKLTFQLMAEVLISCCALLMMLNSAADTMYGECYFIGNTRCKFLLNTVVDTRFSLCGTTICCQSVSVHLPVHRKPVLFRNG